MSERVLCDCGGTMPKGARRCGRCGRTGDAVRTWAEVNAEWRRRTGEIVTNEAMRERGQEATRKLRALLLKDIIIREHLGLPPLEDEDDEEIEAECKEHRR